MDPSIKLAYIKKNWGPDFVLRTRTILATIVSAIVSCHAQYVSALTYGCDVWSKQYYITDSSVGHSRLRANLEPVLLFYYRDVIMTSWTRLIVRHPRIPILG